MHFLFLTGVIFVNIMFCDSSEPTVKAPIPEKVRVKKQFIQDYFNKSERPGLKQLGLKQRAKEFLRAEMIKDQRSSMSVNLLIATPPKKEKENFLHDRR